MIPPFQACYGAICYGAPPPSPSCPSFPFLSLLLIGTAIAVSVLFIAAWAYEAGRDSVHDGQIVRRLGFTFRVKLVRVKMKFEEVSSEE